MGSISSLNSPTPNTDPALSNNIVLPAPVRLYDAIALVGFLVREVTQEFNAPRFSNMLQQSLLLVNSLTHTLLQLFDTVDSRAIYRGFLA